MKGDDGGKDRDHGDHIVEKIGGLDEVVVEVEVKRSLIIQKHLEPVKKVDDDIDKEKAGCGGQKDLPEDPVNVGVGSV